MHRRAYLTATGTLLASALAGCGSDGGTDARNDFDIAVTDTLDDSDDVQLDHAEWQDDVYRLEHTTDAEDLQELMPELMAVAGTFAGAYDAHTPEMREFEAWAYTPSDDLVGTYYIEPEWGQAYMDDELSEDEYINTVAETWS